MAFFKIIRDFAGINVLMDAFVEISTSDDIKSGAEESDDF